MSLPVAVCIVTHNSAADIEGCFAAVAALEHRPLELVLVDCDSSDGSVERARALAPAGMPATIWELGENLGFAGGMNAALQLTAAPWVLLLNPDARPWPDFLERLFERIVACGDMRVAGATGRLLRPGATGDTARIDACGMRLTTTWRHLDRGSGEIDHGQYARPERVFGATGAAVLLSREALDDVAIEGEIFASEFHSFREDAELCFRLRERGWEILYEPTAIAEHRRTNLPQRRRQMTAAVNYHSLKNRYLLRAYHQGGWNLVLTLIPALWRDLVALVYVLARERTSLQAYRWLWQNRLTIRRRRRLIRARRTTSIDRWFVRRGLPL